MKWSALILLVTGVAAIGAIGFKSKPSKAQISIPSSRTARTPVIVELFTSESCSSCPPADSLLASLVEQQPVDGALIVPLSEHVDYWNNLGWHDPFSSSEYTSRQNGYSRALGTDGPYTPQMVIDGQTQVLGSDREAAQAAIDEAAKSEKLQIQLDVSNKDQAMADVRVNLTGLPTNCDVFLTVTESGLESDVQGGENDGRHLRHTGVVRVFRKLGDATAGESSRTASLAIDPKWNRQNCSVVVFAQKQNFGRILGATETAL